MTSRFSVLTQNKRTKAFLSGALLLVVAVTLSIGSTIYGHATSASASAAAHAQRVSGGVSTSVAAHGSVDLSKAPKLTSNSSQKPINLPVDRPLPASQRNKASGMTAGVPHAVAPAKAPGGSQISPNFPGGGIVPELVNSTEGIDYSQSGGWLPPDQAIGVGGGCCASNQYVVEGVNNAIEIYHANNYAVAAGPYSSSTLFSSVMLNGDFLADPQITYDAERVSWVIVYIELTPCGNNCVSHGYIDIAVSGNYTPLGVPSNYHLYRFDVNLNSNNEYCDYPTLGMEYWNLYVTCATFGTLSNANPGAFLGNRTFMFFKTDLYTGSSSPHWGWFYSVNNDLNCGSGAGTCPVYRLAPAIEDGVPAAEWVVGTDAGYLGTTTTSSNLTLFSITNTHALGLGSLPTGYYINGSLIATYADPPGAQQPGTSSLVYTGAGVKQFMYKGGHLWFSFTTNVNWAGDSTNRSAVYWTEIQPFLSTQAADNPQIVTGWNNDQQQYFGYSGAYTYMPSIQPSDEGDAVLVFNYSSSSNYPSIVWTGRQNADALGTMGQGSAFYVISGSNPNGSGRWGDYSACALNIQFTTRGFAYCGGEYGGSQASATGVGWNTFLYTLRME